MVAVTADERRAFVANAGSGTVSVVPIDQPPDEKAGSPAIAIGGTPMGLALTDDGKWLYASNRDGNQILRIDTAHAARRSSRIAVAGEPSRLVLTNGGRLLVASLIGGNAVVGIDTATSREIARLPVGPPARGGAGRRRAPARLRRRAGRRQGRGVLAHRLEGDPRDPDRRSPRFDVAGSRARAQRRRASRGDRRRRHAVLRRRSRGAPGAAPSRAAWTRYLATSSQAARGRSGAASPPSCAPPASRASCPRPIARSSTSRRR